MQTRKRSTAMSLPAVLLFLLWAGPVLAQTRAAPTAAAEEDCGCDDPQAVGPQLWATVAGTRILDTEFKAALAPQLDPLFKELATLRQQGLDDLIAYRLIDREAEAQGVTRTALLRARVDSTLQAATDAEVLAWIDQNRSRINRDPSDAGFRRDVALFLTDQKRTEAVRALGQSLRAKADVKVFPQANTASADASRVLALVEAQPLRKSDLEELIKAPAFELTQRIYDLRRAALDRRIYTLLLELQAKKESLTAQQLYSREVLDRAPIITAEQADAFYAQNRAQISQPLETVRPRIISFLRQQAVEGEEQRFRSELLKTADVQVTLRGVTEPVFSIGTKGHPSQGPQDAAVTIVEFTDYECPRCAEIQPILKQVLAAYPGQVRLVVREFPLTRHVHARKAAQAALCSFEQGKYWEYSALLFGNQAALAEGQLLQYAGRAGMDAALLEKHLKSGHHDLAVQEDLDEGQLVGVNGTPSFYINGRRLEDRSLEGIKLAIEQAMGSR